MLPVDDSTATSPVSRRESDSTQVRPLSEVDPLDKAQTKESTQSEEQPPSQRKADTRQLPVLSAQTATKQWSSMRKRQSPTVREVRAGEDKKRSFSLTSIDDLKMTKASPTKVPLFTRLGRSWSRRMSST